MPSKTQNLQLAIDKYQEYQSLLRQIEGRAAAASAIRVNQLLNELLAIIGQTSNATGAAFSPEFQMEQLIRDLDTAIADLRGNQRDVFRSAYGRLQHATLGTTEVYSAFGRSTAGRVKAARATFIAEARARGPFNTDFKSWVNKFQGNVFRLQDGMKKSLIQAQLEGWNQNQLAESFVKIPEFQFKNLPRIGDRAKAMFRGKGSPSDALLNRARVIARTELNDVGNRMHRSWTKAAGFDLYINMNGAPVAQVCKDANAAGARTYAQWEATLGRPPRHPNCDSGLMAVPEDYQSIIEQQRISDDEDAGRGGTSG